MQYLREDIAALRADNERLKAELENAYRVGIGNIDAANRALDERDADLAALRVAHEVACCERDQARMELAAERADHEATIKAADEDYADRRNQP